MKITVEIEPTEIVEYQKSVLETFFPTMKSNSDYFTKMYEAAAKNMFALTNDFINKSYKGINNGDK